jgi:hypothetical protein
VTRHDWSKHGHDRSEYTHTAHPSPDADSDEDTGTGPPGDGSRTRARRWLIVLGIVLLKLWVITLIALSSQLQIPLVAVFAAAHGALLAAAVTLLVYKLRRKTPPRALPHVPPGGHGAVLAQGGRKVTRMLKSKGSR